jgi:DNA-binding transcriptional LysR family regulator
MICSNNFNLFVNSDRYLDNRRFIRVGIQDLSHWMLKEGEDGPGYRGEYSGTADQEEQQPHFFQSNRVIASVALGEQGVGIWIIPYAPCSVEVLAPDGEVNNLDDTMREKEEGNRIGGEIVDIGALEH